jgi:hypothetical protein
MRSILLTFATAALAFPADPVAKVESPVLGYIYDAKARAVRPITGIPGSASLESAMPSASKLANGFVSQNRQWLLAILLDGGVELVNLQSGVSTSVEGAPADAELGAWSADGTTFALWSRSGVLQVWTGAHDAPTAKYSHAVETAAGIALADRGESVLFWNDAGLFAAAEGNVRQLVAEPVLAAAYRTDSSDWAAVTSGQLLRSDTEPRALSVAGATAVAFLRDGLAVAAKGGVEVIGETASRTIPCDCDATSLDRLAGSDVFRLTGLGSSNLAVYDGSSSEPAILYIPNEGGRQ